MCAPRTESNGKLLERAVSDISMSSPVQSVMDEKIGSSDETATGDVACFLKWLFLAAALSVSVLEFSLWFPFNIPGVSSAAARTYVPAGYKYDLENTLFDNTSWTYSTDYVLTIVMTILAVECIRPKANCEKTNGDSFRLRMYSAALLICYAVSTLAGGWSHQHFTSVESLNTLKFRLFWIVCVGNVSFASCYMGLIGREVQRIFGVKDALPLGPAWFWPLYGLYMFGACAFGYISFKRPACDIFIAGITQFPSTFYCLGALGLRKWPSSRDDTNAKVTAIERVRLLYRLVYYVGFIGNAPLLPLYPLLIQYTSWSLAGVNTFLHCWLMVMWGMQGLSLVHLCRCISAAGNDKRR